MEISALQAQVMQLGYAGSMAVLAVASGLLAVRHRSVIAGIAGSFFVLHVAGSRVMQVAGSELVDARRTHIGQVAAQNHYWIGEVLSLAGIAGGSVLMLLFVWRSGGARDR